MPHTCVCNLPLSLVKSLLESPLYIIGSSFVFKNVDSVRVFTYAHHCIQGHLQPCTSDACLILAARHVQTRPFSEIIWCTNPPGVTLRYRMLVTVLKPRLCRLPVSHFVQQRVFQLFSFLRALTMSSSPDHSSGPFVAATAVREPARHV